MSELTGNVGVPVSVQVQATDSGGSVLTYSAANLPSGLSINSGSGLITGTPTANGSWQTTITATSATAPFPMSQIFTWTIGPVGAPPPPPPLSAVMPNQTSVAGHAVDEEIVVSGGEGTLSYAATGLPPGLSVDAATGQISGVPSAPGSYGGSVTVTDAVGQTATATFTWTIDTVIQMTVPGLPF